MDPIAALGQTVRDLTTVKSVLISGIVLTLYDHLLMFGDEIRYMWRGRKTSIFYLYALNRITLTAFRFWGIYILSGPRNSKAGCIAAYYAEITLTMFSLFSSDIFIALRVYAITFGNKILAVYFGTLALARLAVSLASSFVRPVAFVDLPPIPIDAFNFCAVVPQLQFRFVPNAVGTAFELSAFLVIAWWVGRNMRTLRISAVIRTIVAEATIYFLAMVALQIYIQLSYVLMEGISQQVSALAYALLNPIFTMRFAISLKRSADSEKEWDSKRFSSANFGSGPLSSTQVSAVWESIEMGPVRPSNDRIQTRGR